MSDARPKAKDKYHAEGNIDCYPINPSRLYALEDNPNHPEHANHVERTRLDDADMIALMQSIRACGTRNARPVIAYLDGDRPTLADGRRSRAACIAVNAERKAKGLEPFLLNCITTKDPEAARDIANACRKGDPPMVLARRFVAAVDAGLDRGTAAARNGLTLAMAGSLERCLKLPAEIQARVNRGELAADVAARMGKAGANAAVEAVASSVDADTGKVNAATAKKAAREVTPNRPRGLNRDAVSTLANRVEIGEAKQYSAMTVAKMLRYVMGDREVVNGHAQLVALTSDLTKRSAGKVAE